MLSVLNYPDRTVTARIFKVCVLTQGKPRNVDARLCEGVLKRVFSKQICYSYEFLSFQTNASGFDICFRFVCWKPEAQASRYRTFEKMDQSKLEENVRKHSHKTVDGFVGEFFKRLKRQKFNVEIDGKPARIIEPSY